MKTRFDWPRDVLLVICVTFCRLNFTWQKYYEPAGFSAKIKSVNNFYFCASVIQNAIEGQPFNLNEKNNQNALKVNLKPYFCKKGNDWNFIR